MMTSLRKKTPMIVVWGIASVAVMVTIAFFLFFKQDSSVEKQEKLIKSIPLNQLIGQFDETNDPNFIALDSTDLPVNKKGMYLQKEVAMKLVEAYHDFHLEHPDIPFIIVSATRNYLYQNRIWKNKWDALSSQFSDPKKIASQILRFSSMPGTSRHHWGTDVDITDLTSAFFLNDKKGKVLYQWLVQNMPKYGFCQAYNQGRQGGYLPEEWHWSYQPIASEYLKQYKAILTDNPSVIMQLLTFQGADQIDLEKRVKEYVLTINPDCF